jgi:hypothetical protein
VLKLKSFYALYRGPESIRLSLSVVVGSIPGCLLGALFEQSNGELVSSLRRYTYFIRRSCIGFDVLQPLMKIKISSETVACLTALQIIKAVIRPAPSTRHSGIEIHPSISFRDANNLIFVMASNFF